MENTPPTRPVSAGTPGQIDSNNGPSQIPNRKRSGSGGSILSRFPFMRTSDSKSNLRESRHVDSTEDLPSVTPRLVDPMQPAQQQKARKRKGSLRKVALLGRGAQRDRRELTPLAIETTPQVEVEPASGKSSVAIASSELVSSPLAMDLSGTGLGISDVTPRPSMDGYAHRTNMPTRAPPPIPDPESPTTGSSVPYISTTDEEDVVSMKQRLPSTPPSGTTSLSSGSETYFKPTRTPSLSLQRRRSIKHAKSPLSLQGLAASPLPVHEEEYDYTETEWWGWVILVVTWVVFVTGMGSCLGIWSWAWDVGTTPYAPPELEDDPTLPITGYYPTLIILTCIMAWVWVITAWMGMKYFRHAKISGD